VKNNIWGDKGKKNQFSRKCGH